MKLFVTCYIILLSLSVAFADICPQKQAGIINWSSWNGRPSASNQNVTVAAGQIILLDVAPPPIFKLDIYGTLVFSPTVSLELIASFIYVRTGGYLWVGSESCPITANVIITLVGGYNPTLNPDLVGSKVLGVFAGGNLDIHGVPRTPTWTVLNQNTLSGDTQITLAQNVDWAIGEYIVLANTDFDPNVGQAPGFGLGTQSEVVKITSKPQPNVVGFSTPLQYPHYGKIWSSPNGDSIDMRGEVGLLTRNILIRGDINNISSPNAAAMHWGGHVIMRDGGSARIAYAEFVNGGQKDLIGRYPVHFHYTGNRQDSYVRGNSIHDTFQRCVTVHGTNNVRVQNNVAHNSYGHCYFLEDGNEEGNRFEHNLGVYTRPHTLVKSDSQPAMFWISNPNNHFYGNVAAGGNFGFWYSTGTHPWGLAKDDIYNFLRLKPAGDFVNNKAHSVTFGLFVDKGQNDADGDLDFETAYTPVNFTTALQLNPSLNTSSMPNDYGSAIGVPVYVYFVNFVAYKCADHGIWTMGASQYVYGAKLADNAVAFELVGASNMISNSLIVGETDNVGYPASQYIFLTYVNQEGRSRFNKGDLSSPIFGFTAYDGGGGLTFYNLTFVNFNNYKFSNGVVRPSAAVTSSDGPNVPVANSKFFKLKFYNVDNPVYFSNRSLTNSVLGASIPDVDGSLTQGYGGGCGSVVISSFSPILRHPSCVAKPAWNAYLCPPGIPALRVLQIWGAGSQNPSKPFYLTKLSDRSNIQLNFYFYRQQFTIPVNQEYYVTYDKNNQMLASGSFVVDLMPGEWVRIAIPLPDVSMTMKKGWTTYTRVSTKSQLGSGKYFYDSGASIVWFHLEATSYGFNYYQGLPFRNGGDSIDWSASCGGPLCSYASTVTAPTGSPAPVAPYYDFCETAGGVSKGINSYTVKSPASYVMYNGTLQAPLQFDSTCVSSTSVVYNGSPSIVCTYTGTGGATGINRGFFYRSNLPSISAYTHLQLVVRAAPNFGVIDNTIYASNCSGAWLGYQVSLSSPFYTDDGQSVSDKRWTTVTIPISDIAKSDNFCGISLGNNIGRPVIIYINSIKWVSLTQSLNAVSNYPNNFPVPVYVGPGSEFKY